MLALLKTPAQYDAQQLKLAMKVHKHTTKMSTLTEKAIRAYLTTFV